MDGWLVQPLLFLPSFCLYSAVSAASLDSTVSFVADRSLTGDGFVAVMPKLTGSLVVERTGTLSTISLTLLFTLVHHARED